MKKNWYAVYTKLHCEIKVAALLTKKKIDSYCPLNRIVSSQGNKKKVLYEPLFPSFVFVYASDTEIPIIRKTGSIVNFVFWLGKPVVIKDTEIENLRNFTNQFYNVQLEKTAVNANGIVRIINDPNTDVNMIFVKNSYSQLLLPSLGYLIRADIETSTIDLSYDIEKSKMVS